MKRKNMFVVSLAITLIVSVLSACGSSSSQPSNNVKNGSASTEKNKNLKIMRTYHAGLEQFKGSDDFNSNKLVNLLKEWSGYNVNYEPLPKDNVSQKISVLLASGDVPDMLWIPGKPDYFKLAQQGSFEPLDDLIEKYIPNISTVFSQSELDAPSLMALLTAFLFVWRKRLAMDFWSERISWRN